MKRPTRLLISVCLLLLAALTPLSALDRLQIDAGLVYQVNSEEDSAPSPLMPAAGIVLPWKAFGKWQSELSFLTFGTYYRLAAGRALPAELEQRDFWVQGILAALRLGPEFTLGEKLRLGLTGGVSLLVRAPVPLFSDVKGDWGDLSAYLYGMARFLYPEAGLYAETPLRERLSVRLSARASIPLFHLWDGEGLPFTDQLLAGLLLGFVIELP